MPLVSGGMSSSHRGKERDDAARVGRVGAADYQMRVEKVFEL